MIAEVTSYDGEIIWDINKPDGTSQEIIRYFKIKKLDGIQKLN